MPIGFENWKNYDLKNYDLLKIQSRKAPLGVVGSTLLSLSNKQKAFFVSSYLEEGQGPGPTQLQSAPVDTAVFANGAPHRGVGGCMMCSPGHHTWQPRRRPWLRAKTLGSSLMAQRVKDPELLLQCG